MSATRKGGTRDGLFQRHGWWWVDYRDADGKRHRKKAAPDYNTAKLIYRDLMSKIAKGEVTGVREEGVTFSTFVETHYWPAVKPTVSASWAVRTRGVLDHQLLPRFGGLVTAIRRETIEAWYGERCAAVKASTANKELGRLKHALGRAVDWGYLRVSPAARIRKVKEPSGRTRYLTDEERTRLLEGDLVSVKASDGRAWTYRRAPSPTLYAYMVAALQTGARRGELCRLSGVNADWKMKTITLRATKSKTVRTLPMSEPLEALLRSLPRSLDPAAPLLPPVRPEELTRAFRRYVRTIGLADLTFHDLRHDVGSTLAMAGVPQRAIMEILGHRDLRMSARYQHVAPDHLRSAVGALGGGRGSGAGPIGTI
jgi:integrase